MRPDDTQIGEQARDGFRGHRGAPVGVHDLRDTVDREHLAHHFFCQDGGFGDMDVRADEIARVDVDHDVGVVVTPRAGPGHLGDVPGEHLPRTGRDQLGTGSGRMAGKATTPGQRSALRAAGVARR